MADEAWSSKSDELEDKLLFHFTWFSLEVFEVIQFRQQYLVLMKSLNRKVTGYLLPDCRSSV